MNKLDFYKEFGNIDDKLILEADLSQRKKLFLKPFIIAASLLVIVLTVAAFSLNHNTPTLISPSADTTISTNEPDNSNSNEHITSSSVDPIASSPPESVNIFYNETDKMVGSLLKIPGHFWQKLSQEEKHSVFGNLVYRYDIAATANFSKENQNISLFNIQATFQAENGSDINLTISENPIYDCYVLEKDSTVKTDVNGIPIVFGIYKNESSDTQTFFAEFNSDNIYYSAQMTSTQKNEKYFSLFINELTVSNKINLNAVTPVVPELKDETLTLEEVYSDNTFGSFVPKNIPSNFEFESARRFINQEYNYLSVLWCYELNDISFRIEYATDHEKKNITSVNDLKNYDLSLYPIPRGESVPEELWEIVQSPVFIAEEISEEVITRRVTEHNEDGKTVKKINFSLIFDNDIVITVSTSGIEPKEVFNMLTEIIKGNY